jgi:hypothetical protein
MDYARTFGTNNLIINRNGKLIEGQSNNYTVNTNGAKITFIYVDDVMGWKIF